MKINRSQKTSCGCLSYISEQLLFLKTRPDWPFVLTIASIYVISAEDFWWYRLPSADSGTSRRGLVHALGSVQAGLVPCGHPGWGHLDSGKQRRDSELMATNCEASRALWGVWPWPVLLLNKDIVLKSKGSAAENPAQSSLIDSFKPASS